MSRQMRSGVPPAACETMILIGRLGQVSALAGTNDSSSKASSVAARTNMDIFFSLQRGLRARFLNPIKNNDSMSGNATLIQVNGPPRSVPAGQARRWRLPRCRRFCRLKFPNVRGAERAEDMNATESNAMKHAQLLFCLGVLMISATAALAKPAYVTTTVKLRAAPGTPSQIAARIH